MKTKTTLAAAILLTAVTSQATPLIDLIPGGWEDFTTPVPSALFTNLHRGFDEIRTIPWRDNNGQLHPPGWVSTYGILRGPDFIQVDITSPVSQVEWNFTKSPYQLLYLWVTGVDEQNVGWTDVYKVRPQNGNGSSGGFLPVTINEDVTIQTISFWGRFTNDSLPETGSTGLFLVIALVGIAYAKNRIV